MSSLTREKLAQAVALVPRSGADLWLTFVRETSAAGDPALPLILDGGLTWQSALMVSSKGEKVAVVGNYDADPLIASGDWDRVVPYVQDIAPVLRDELAKLLPSGGKIAVNMSESDVMADGLTHGMFVVLSKILDGLPYELVSAERTVMALRGIKSSEELARIREALVETERMFGDIAIFAQVGVTESAVYNHVHALAKERGLGFSWDPHGDPIVNSGPDSMIGHGIPSDSITIQPGHIFHIDLGLTKNGYSSDIQRCWFVGDSVPEDVTHALESVKRAIRTGFALLKPGVQGWEVDAAARASLIADGYPEYMHALGHQVGRVAHDGGAILGPKWKRYGNTPMIPVEEGEVYTIELGITVPNRGYLGLEEMVVVRADGAEWLIPPQESMPLL
jgi:Xaa-Pro aminopeptidase